MSLVGRYALYLTALLLITAGCNQQVVKKEIDKYPPPVIGIDLEEIRKRGHLTVVFDNSSTSYFIYKGQPMGYEYDLMKRFCDREGLTMEIIKTSSIEEAFKLLNEGKADVIAYFLTVTSERKEYISFTDALQYTEQVLVQRKPSRKRLVSNDEETPENLVRNPVDLIGKTIYLRPESAFVDRIHNLSSEIGGEIKIDLSDKQVETEELIQMVAEGDIDYTVADKAVALVNAAYYPSLDVETHLSLPQQVAWGVRKTSPVLQSSLNDFIYDISRSSLHQVIYNKYFKVSRNLIERAKSEMSSIGGGGYISPYDDIVKSWADSIGWDWKLIVSMIYQESRFNPQAGSWAGARGLMQLVPVTGRRFGAENLYDPYQNIMAGTRFIKYLEVFWKQYVPDSTERVKFVLASYNAGLGHVQDAYALAEALGYDNQVWDDQVGYCMTLKSDPAYFRMDVVKYGYCRGQSVVSYVDNILYRYLQYLDHYREEELKEEEVL